MSVNVDMAGSGDPRAPPLPVEGHGKPGVEMWAGGVEAHRLMKEALRQEAAKGKEEKRERKEEREEGKEKERERKRERKRAGSGWRGLARLMSCFGCGAAEQDEVDSYEQEVLRVQERVRKAHQASRQHLLKLRRDDLARRENFKRIVRRRRLVDVNEEWSALPTKPEDVESKVAFREVGAGDVWFYHDEEKPRQRHLVWMKVLEEIRESDMARALQQKGVEKETQLTQLSEGQDALMASQRQAAARGQSDHFRLVSSAVGLGLGIYYMVWLPATN
ncbi:hypothetical protein ACEWY4_004791 [Coilia grayii]|uniref:Uncharacterized protein n=1 Tax=Coilia grayii TaxID=363190 RepID=A0ABD1KMQ1_9TELE